MHRRYSGHEIVVKKQKTPDQQDPGKGKARILVVG
jgi:hypothetical protein